MLNECLNCATRFAADLEQCPHCGSREYHDQGVQQMPRVNTNGITDKYQDGYYDEDATREDRVDDRGVPDSAEQEESFPGNSSSTSTEKQQKTDGPNVTADQKPARSTASLSKKAQEDNSTAASAEGSTKGDKK